MAKGYWIVHLAVTDPEAYAHYRDFVRPFLAEWGGRFLVSGTTRLVTEGEARERSVVVEFSSYAKAVSAYESDAYQAGMQQRLAASVADFVIAEGVDG